MNPHPTMPALIAPHHRPAPSFITLFRLLLLLTVLPLSIAAFAFLLQWRGPVLLDDPFPGLDNSPTSPYLSKAVATSASGCEEVLGRTAGLGFPHYRGWSFDIEDHDPNPKVSITTTTSAGLEQILPWLFYHKVVGVTHFFLFAEGKAATPKVAAVLESIPGVKVIPRTPEFEELQSKSRIWNETWLSNYFYKPCNNELFVKQTLNMEMGILMARDAGMDWIIHLDTDELIHPAGAKEYSVRQLLSDIPSDVDLVVFPNYESSIERDDIKDPFSEVSMFKKNYDHLPKNTYFSSYKEATRSNPSYFLTYGNGKSAARIKDHLRPNGAHRWHNYRIPPKEIKMEEAVVLHYSYTKFSDLTSRRDRCSCKPTMDDVKRCFMLEFDQVAFITASTASEEDMLRWYRTHVVWTDKELNLKLIRKGIMTRIYAPMTIIQGLRDSGVFSSAIASAQTLPKGKLSSSVETLQKYSSKLLSNDRSANSKRVSTSKESHATTRKILEIAEVFDHEIAVPPMPPQGFSYFHKRT